MIETITTTTTALTAGQIIPLGSITARTNANVSISNDSLQINRAGYYNVSGQFVVTGTSAGNITIQLYANGTAINGAYSTVTIAEGSTLTIDLDKIVKILPSNNTDKVDLTFKTLTACTLANSIVNVQKVI